MISAIVTAAGKNRRMQEDQKRLGLNFHHKLLLDLQGKPVIIRTLDNVLKTQIEQCVVVLGHYSSKIRVVLENYNQENIKIISNANPEVQLSETLLNGVNNIKEDGLCLCVAADQPTVSIRSMNRLISQVQNYPDQENIVSILARRDDGYLKSTMGLGMPFVCHSFLLKNYLPQKNDNLNPILGDMLDDGVVFYGVSPVHKGELTNINYWDDYLKVRKLYM
ncbi:MAG: NTP transferase domain-containing protein [Methanobacterium sp.]|nr:NTP transferase domain-containing protein [Methanobacterium sp.]